MRKQKIRIFPKHAIRSGSFRTSNCIVYMRGNFTFELAPGVLSRSEQICAGTGAICEQPTTSQVNYCCVVSIAKPQQIFRSYSSKLTTAFRFAFVCVNKGCVATLACVASPHVPCLCTYICSSFFLRTLPPQWCFSVVTERWPWLLESCWHQRLCKVVKIPSMPPGKKQ